MEALKAKYESFVSKINDIKIIPSEKYDKLKAVLECYINLTKIHFNIAFIKVLNSLHMIFEIFCLEVPSVRRYHGMPGLYFIYAIFIIILFLINLTLKLINFISSKTLKTWVSIVLEIIIMFITNVFCILGVANAIITHRKSRVKLYLTIQEIDECLNQTFGIKFDDSYSLPLIITIHVMLVLKIILNFYFYEIFSLEFQDFLIGLIIIQIYYVYDMLYMRFLKLNQQLNNLDQYLSYLNKNSVYKMKLMAMQTSIFKSNLDMLYFMKKYDILCDLLILSLEIYSKFMWLLRILCVVNLLKYLDVQVGFIAREEWKQSALMASLSDCVLFLVSSFLHSESICVLHSLMNVRS